MTKVPKSLLHRICFVTYGTCVTLHGRKRNIFYLRHPYAVAAVISVMNTEFFEVIPPAVHHLLEAFYYNLAVGELIERLNELTVKSLLENFSSNCRYSISLPVQTRVARLSPRLLLSGTNTASTAPTIPVVPDSLFSGSLSPCLRR